MALFSKIQHVHLLEQMPSFFGVGGVSKNCVFETSPKVVDVQGLVTATNYFHLEKFEILLLILKKNPLATGEKTVRNATSDISIS